MQPISGRAPTSRDSQTGSAAHAIPCLTAAFRADPPVRWMYPDRAEYALWFPLFAKAFGGAALDTKSAVLVPGGAALWLAPGVAPDEAAIGDVIAASVPDARRQDVFAVFEAMDRAHIEEPHWYLPMMGVLPAHQGQGLGQALMRPVLDQCDATRVPAYLEATTERSKALYSRLGFEPLGTIRVAGCPPIHPMVRRPQ